MSGGPDRHSDGLAPGDGFEFWLGPILMHRLDPRSFHAGLVTINVTASSPCYAALRVKFVDATLAPLAAPLERVGERHYRATVQLIAPAATAWIETRSGTGRLGVDIRISGPSAYHLARVGLAALRRHVGAPATFLKKLVQIGRGGASLVLREGAEVASGVDDTYANWRLAFDNEELAQRLVDAWTRDGQRGPVRLVIFDTTPQQASGASNSVVTSLGAALNTEIVWMGRAARDGTALDFARAIVESSPDLVIVTGRTGRFHRLAPLAFALALVRDPSADAVTGDHDAESETDGCVVPTFKPAWSPRYQLATDYVGDVTAFRPTWLGNLLAGETFARSTIPTPSTLMALLAARALHAAHVPLVLFHAAHHASENVAAAPAKNQTDAPSISVIIPTRDNPEMLAAAVASVRNAAHVDAEVILVDNGATSAGQRRVLEDVAARSTGHGRGKVIEAHQPFNFSALINRGRAAATGRVLVLLNDDVEALDRNWLHALATEASRPDTGAVGALLLYPDGRVQHAGVLLGINGGAGHAWRFADPDDPRHKAIIGARREVSAVTAACLAVRADVYDRVGGFAEDLPVTLNDVDFCLKLRALGLANVYLPTARLIHRESTSRGIDATPDKLRRLARETGQFIERWGSAGLCDPYLGPHADPSREDFKSRRL